MVASLLAACRLLRGKAPGAERTAARAAIDAAKIQSGECEPAGGQLRNRVFSWNIPRESRRRILIA